MGNRASVQAPGTSKAGKEAAAAQCEGGAAAVTDAPSGAIAAAAAAAPDEGFQWRAKRTSLVVDGCGSPRRASTAGAEDDYLDDAFEAAVQGIVVVVLESQNILAVTAIKNIVSTYLDNIFC